MKPGYKTTEFWMTLIAGLLPVLLPDVSPDVVVAAVSGVAGIYTGARAAVKRKGG